MNDRLAIAAMLLATTAQRREVNGDDVLSATKCADDLIRTESGFDNRFATTVFFGNGSPPSPCRCKAINVDVAAGESETVAVQVVPTVYVDDFAFQVGDRCECRDHVPRTISILGVDGRPDRYNCGTSKINIDQFARFFQLFHGATVYRDGKAVAVLSTDPEAFRLLIGDVVIIPDVCGRIITDESPLAWTGCGGVCDETDPENRQFVRQLRRGAVWRNGELVREAVV